MVRARLTRLETEESSIVGDIIYTYTFTAVSTKRYPLNNLEVGTKYDINETPPAEVRYIEKSVESNG